MMISRPIDHSPDPEEFLSLERKHSTIRKKSIIKGFAIYLFVSMHWQFCAISYATPKTAGRFFVLNQVL